jgi:hypothetical protein
MDATIRQPSLGYGIVLPNDWYDLGQAIAIFSENAPGIGRFALNYLPSWECDSDFIINSSYYKVRAFVDIHEKKAS